MKTSLDSQPKYPVKSLDKALSILELMIETGDDLAISEIARRLEFGKGTVHRILSTLKARKFVQQDRETQKYGLGIRALDMGTALKKDDILRNAIMPVLNELARRVRETISASILVSNEVRYIARMESDEPLRLSITAGTHFPAHCSATGKMLLAGLSDDELKRLYRRKSAFMEKTSSSIGSLGELLKAMKQIRQADLAYDYEEAFVGVYGVAAAVRNDRNEIIAAIGIAGPKARMSRAKMKEFAESINKAAIEISYRLFG